MSREDPLSEAATAAVPEGSGKGQKVGRCATTCNTSITFDKLATGLTSLGITQKPFFTFSNLRPALAVDDHVLATVLLPQRRGRGPGSRQRTLPPPVGGS